MGERPFHKAHKISMSFKTVIFDFGGVFTTSPLQNFAAFENEHDLPKNFIGGVIKNNHHANAWAQFERAEIDLDQFDWLFAQESRAAGYEISGNTLMKLMSFHIHQPMAAALQKVKSLGLKTGCITNNTPDQNKPTRGLSPKDIAQLKAIFSSFDHVIESAKAGVRKPEPRIYEMMCEALEASPDQCVFLDDLGINLKPAQAMGMKTIKVPLSDVRPAIEELYDCLGVSHV